MKTSLVVVLLSWLLMVPALGQKLQLNPQQSELVICGTSNLHDWSMNADQLSATATANLSGPQPQLTALKFSVPVTGLKSGNRVMDKNTQKALEADEHPQIWFQLSRVERVQIQDKGYLLQGTGQLHIAGTTRPVTLQAEAFLTGSANAQKLVLSGTFRQNMRDYGVEPPTAIMGTLRTGEIIDIKFNFLFQPIP
jgi:polyisoprenoid-binding protein YceI